MTKRTRIIILVICFILFFTITPWLILYSLGYRIDFKNQCIVATGGIYVRTSPAARDVIIDGNIDQKIGTFSSSAFVQNLLPDKHSILVKKDGYFDYNKKIDVKENEVTKIENIVLFKNNINFKEIISNISYISFSPNNRIALIQEIKNNKTNLLFVDLTDGSLAYEGSVEWNKDDETINVSWDNNSSKVLIKTSSGYYIWQLPDIESARPILLKQLAGFEAEFNSSNSNEIFLIKKNSLYSLDISNTTASTIETGANKKILDKVLAYEFNNGKIIWLGLDGNLNQSDIDGKNNQILTNAPILIGNNSYKIFNNNFGIFVLKDKDLLLLNNKTGAFNIFMPEVKDLKTSSDNQNIFYATDNEIHLNHSNYEYEQNQPKPDQKILLNKFYENISNIFWLNNDYLILRANDKIKISEIDNRGNINIIDLPLPANFSLNSKSQIYFNQSDKKLYVLSSDILFSSDKLLP